MDSSTLAPAAMIQVVAVYAIQKLKSAGWFPWLGAHTALANRTVAVFIAAVTASGITWQWNAANGDLSVHGLVWPTVAQGLWTWLAGIATNEMAYMVLQIKTQTAAAHIQAPPGTPAGSVVVQAFNTPASGLEPIGARAESTSGEPGELAGG